MDRRRLKNDIILALSLLLTAAALYLVFALQKGDGAEAVVTVDGIVAARYSLAENREETIKTEYGENTLEIKDGYAKITSADCKNQVCVHMKKIGRGGEAITCLPHHLSVTVESERGVDFVQ